MENFKKIKIILNFKEKIKFIFLLIYSFINSILELISIGLIILIIISLFDTDKNNFFVKFEFLKNIGFDLNQNEIVFFLFFFIILILNNIFFFFYNYKLSNFYIL